MKNENSLKKYAVYASQIVAAGILFTVGILKFLDDYNQTDVQIFTALGMEPTGRIIIGIIEICSALFLLTDILAAPGALLAICTMVGALIAHISKLGWDFNHAILWSTVILNSLFIAYQKRKQLPLIGNTL